MYITPAAAQQVPDQATKIKALKCAYFLNGNSFRLSPDGRMHPMIDVSGEDLDHCVPAAIPMAPIPRLENDYLKRIR
jgi:hypothetical protein